ncbi:MAG: PEGA domain-containing protein [Polyangia bacterium]
MKRANPFESVVAVVLGCALILASPGAAAGDKAEARQHFESGLALLEAEDYAAAASEFEVSVGLYPTRNGLFNLANCYKALHRYGDALEAVARLREEFAGRLDERWKKEIATFERTLEAMVGRLAIEVDRPGASIEVDGEPLGESPLAGPLALAPGSHEIVVELEGFAAQRREVRLVSGERLEESFALEREEPGGPPAPAAEPSEEIEPPPEPPEPPEPEEEPSATAIWGWVALGTGLAAGIGSGVFYGLAGRSAGEFDAAREEYEGALETLGTSPSDPDALDSEQSSWSEMSSASDEMETRQNLGLTFAVVGGALVATGISLLAVGAGGEEEEPQVELTAAPGGMALTF